MRKLFASLMLLVGATVFAGSCDNGGCNTNCNPCGYNDCCYDDCCMDWCSGWTFSADYLYWRATRSGLDYVAEGELLGGKVCNVCTDYDSGYRLALFKQDDCVSWDFGVRYTSYCSETKDRKTGTDLTTTRFSSFDATIDAEGKYKVDYDVVDLIAGYTHCFECVDAWARPYAGVRLAWIKQRMETNYLLTNTGDVAANIKQVLDMDAYGLEVGVDGRLGFCDGQFGITGHAGMSILHACFDNSLFESGFVMGSPEVFLDMDNDGTIAKVPVFEIGVGLDWWFCCCDCWDVGIEVGYEFQAWRTPEFLFLDQALLPSSFVPDRDRAFLGFQGLYVRVSLGF